MFDEPLAAVTVTAIATVLLFVATVLLFIATWRTATAAKQNARIAAREFQLLRRPLVAVKWRAHPMPDGRVLAYAEVAEVAGIATTLHSVEAIATLVFDEGMPADVQKEEPNTTLSGDTATHGLALAFEVPQRLLSRGGSIVEVAHLYVKVVISADDDEADEETWCGTSVLDFDTKQRRYEVQNTRPQMRRLSRRTGGGRSRIVDPVLGAWERFWDGVS